MIILCVNVLVHGSHSPFFVLRNLLESSCGPRRNRSVATTRFRGISCPPSPTFTPTAVLARAEQPAPQPEAPGSRKSRRGFVDFIPSSGSDSDSPPLGNRPIGDSFRLVSWQISPHWAANKAYTPVFHEIFTDSQQMTENFAELPKFMRILPD